ncbi:MAG: hypothetical protein WBD74_10310 [Candidatus Aquilonibacter sp.]
MFLIAIITAGMLSAAHTGSAPVVNAPVANAPSVVFDRPTPAPVHKPVKPAAPPPLAHGVPLAVPLAGTAVCYRYIVNPVLDPKYQTIANAGISQAACINAPPGARVEP